MARMNLGWLALLGCSLAIAARGAPAKMGRTAAAFDVNSLPQVETKTTFSVAVKSNDSNCISTSLQAIGSDKYIQVCGRNVDATSSTTTSSTEAPAEQNASPQSFLRKAPQTAEGGSETTPIAESYVQLLNKSDISVLKQIVAADSTTIYHSATAYDANTLMVSLKKTPSTINFLDSATLEAKEVTLESEDAAVTTKDLDIDARAIAWDSVNKKLYATDGTTHEIFVYNAQLQQEKKVAVICGKDGVNTTHLGDIVYVKPYLYIAIEGTSNMVRVDMTKSECDKTWLVDFATYTDAAYAEADKKITSIYMDTSITEYVGTGFPTMLIAGDRWTKTYELSGASTYIVNSMIIFAITAVTGFFSS